MRRRDFIKVIVGSAASALPLGALAQQPLDRRGLGMPDTWLQQFVKVYVKQAIQVTKL
jgi:hypothetical protein